MTIRRRKSKIIKIGNIEIGGDNPIAIQSMVKAETKDIDKVIKQIKRLAKMGCQIVRLSIKDIEDARALSRIKKDITIPLVADIHFDYRLALEAIRNGIDKIRLNPGNIYKKNELYKIVDLAKKKRIPIRVGVNSGSLKGIKSRDEKYKVGQAQVVIAMVKSACDYIKILEDSGFYDIVVSLKASDVSTTIEAYRQMAGRCSYPFHLGITATGLPQMGKIKSAVGIGALLAEGIGDTVRVSLTSNPEKEVEVAKEILQSLGLRRFRHEIISCPTCGRCEVDLVKIVRELEKKLSKKLSTIPAKNIGGSAKYYGGNCKLSTVNSQPFRVALMGCVVNGPGEAKEADIGIAAGRKSGLLFKKGKVISKVAESQFVDTLIEQILAIS